jgi:hypothetical protein
MSAFYEALSQRFGSEQCQHVATDSGAIELVLVQIPAKHCTLLLTNGLSAYKMPVHEKEVGNEHNELYFCLPSYWDINATELATMNWVFEWINRLAHFVVEKNTWFGHGHTMPCGKDKKELSPTMKQNHFFLSRPIYLEDELTPLQLPDYTVRFLAIIPVFEKEVEYKLHRGTLKFMDKLNTQGVSEKLDDYRGSVMKSKWRLLRKK